MSKQKKRGFSDLHSHASSHSPYKYDGNDISMVRPGEATTTAAANMTTPSQEKMGSTSNANGSEDSKMLLRPEKDKMPGLHSFGGNGNTGCSRLCKTMLSIEKGEAENFAGETILLKSILAILGLCFVISTTAFIVTACAMGLEEEGYDRYMANHSKLYHPSTDIGQAASSWSTDTMTAMDDQEMMAMQRLQGVYDNITSGIGGD